MPAANISLDVNTHSLLTLVAINAGQLQVQSAVENRFISEVINNATLPLVKGLWLTDSVVGNVKNALAFGRASGIFSHNVKAVLGVITVSTVGDQIDATLVRLLDDDVQTTLLNGNSTEILTVLLGS